MSTPLDPNPGNQQYGQPPQFGAPVPPGPQQPPQPAQPVQPADAAPWGQQPPPQAAPAWGAQPTAPYPDPNANPYQQPYAGVPMQQQPVKQRGTGVAGFFAVLFRTVLGRIIIGLVVVGGIAIYHFVTNDSAQRSSTTGQVTQAGSVQATDLKVGDCFDAPSGNSGISTIKAVPCTQAHDSQVYLEPKITEASFPGQSALETEASNACGSSSAQSAVSSSAPTSLQTAYYYPQDDATFAVQNFIICTIVSSSANLTQSYVS